MTYQYALINVAPQGAVIEEHRKWLYEMPFSAYFDSKEAATQRKHEIEILREETEQLRKVNPSAVWIVPGTTVGIVRRKATFSDWEII